MCTCDIVRIKDNEYGDESKKEENILQYIVHVEDGDEKNRGGIKNKKKMFNKNDEKKIIGVCFAWTLYRMYSRTKDTRNKNDNIKELYHKCESSIRRLSSNILSNISFKYFVREFSPNLVSTIYIRRHILIVWSVIIKLDELFSQYHTCLRSDLYGYSESE